MRRKGARLSVATVLADARTQNQGQRHGGEPSHRVHHRRAREIDITVAEVHRGTELRHPAAAPDPAAEDGVEHRAHEEFAQQEGPERDALADRAHDDVARGLHEHNLEERQAIAARVIGRAGQEEAFAPQEAPLSAADQKVIERGSAARYWPAPR